MNDEKVEALRAFGWSDELIRHFMSDSVQIPDFPQEPVLSQVYESNSITLKYTVSESMIYKSVKRKKKRK